LGIFELMLMTSKVREQAFEGASTQNIRKTAIGQGMITLYYDGIQKALRGITKLEEVFRVAKKTEH
jgi:type II secretory ATPase GspE/PulE/Tfp pilus assembly ATPase PilB-like protein